jgi:hypothetical protein
MFASESLDVPNGPVTIDVGTNPPCNEGFTGNPVTIRCIYNYSGGS